MIIIEANLFSVILLKLLHYMYIYLSQTMIIITYDYIEN